jgi:hypothetical protein
VSQQYVEPESELPPAHRILKIVAWVLVALGFLAWFVLGANRPVDPVLSPVPGVVVPVGGSGLTG